MRILTTTLLATFLATGANAATVLIDDFNEDQLVQDTSGTSSSQIAADVPGGFRDLQAVSDSGEFTSTEVRVANGTLGFSNISGVSGTGFLTYDGNDDPTTVDTSGLGGFDLTFGGLGTGFVYDVISADAQLLLTINAWDLTGGFSTFSLTLPADFAGTFSGMFSEFSGDANLSNLGALQFVAGGNGVVDLDARLNSIGVSLVPVPAAGLLLGGALMGGAAIARRRRKAATA